MWKQLGDQDTSRTAPSVVPNTPPRTVGTSATRVNAPLKSGARSTRNLLPCTAASAPSATSQNPKTGNSASTTATKQAESENFCATAATEASDSPGTTQTSSMRRKRTSKDTQARNQKIVELRKRGLSYDKIGRIVGLSAYRVGDICRQFAPPPTCWCGTTISPGKKYCSREHWPKTVNADKRRRGNGKPIHVTGQQYQAMHDAQNGLCGICTQPERSTRFGKPAKLSIDHDYDTGELRDLLCSNCNVMLGMFKENRYLVAKAAAYLREHEEQPTVEASRIHGDASTSPPR